MSTTSDNKTAARLPRGLVDRTADDIRAMDEMTSKIRQTYELYGFEPVETPIIEYTDALGKFLPDQDRPNEGVFSFQDDDEQWLSLRYDLTAPLARYVAENYERLPKPYRSFRAGWVFRNEKPGPGRFRQFMQFDADTVGAPSVSADAEMCMMMADTLEALGIARGDYVIRVNNRKVLDGAMEAARLAGDTLAGVRLNALRALDKFDKFGLEGVSLLLGPGRRDESGDFTKGCALEGDQIAILLSILGDQPLHSLADTIAASVRGVEGIEELKTIEELVRSAGYGEDRIKIDTSVVRGLEYYTGPVFEAELLFPVTNEDGQVVRFGSVGGGGRYDGLVGRFLKEDVPATGFSIGVSRLASALKTLGKLGAKRTRGPVVVLVMDKSAIASYQTMVAELRAAGIRAEMYLGSSGMKAQMKYADRRDAPLAIIEGSNEREAGEVQIKDLDLGKEMSKEIADNETWRASRPAQVTVKRADLVAEVSRMLAAMAEG
ncbi:Histidine-tRNA ligase [Hartmannibacter diazotrophicus]|uniref:Histidine--tRNA ligase n=1 Tax=Hartmannibacter diazotrophicus TaxID=1482074 RepID=A0A2C9D374_9HYPH|nr:histidine--tRNA ligase [Hartmannibacter diazotrophicus]SON54608.1 Histidine-tRNA ligase [Hartmannibacter diazotrophicus]